MPESDDLPEFATLTSLTLQDLRSAIDRSGYPFQAAIANRIRSAFGSAVTNFHIQEEWAFLDHDEEKIRAIDVFAQACLVTDNLEDDERIRPIINLLVECKQSEYPYIFFVREDPPEQVHSFPEIVGPSFSDIDVFWEESGDFAVSCSLHDTFSFWSETFFDQPAPSAISFAKAVRKGGKVELTGDESYRSLTMPVFKPRTI